jgi:hypothetical protein
MKGKQFALILVLLVVLGGVAMFLSRRNSAEWASTATSAGDKILTFPLNDVSQVTIKTGGSELNLTKKKEDVWTVQERANYPADFDKVSGLLRKFWELKPVQDVKIGPSQLGRLQLTEPSGDANSSILVDFKGGDQRLAAVLLGKTYQRNSDQATGPLGGFPAGRYLMTQDGTNRVFLVSDPLSEVQTKPEQWLNRDFVKVEGPKIIAVTGQTPPLNWSLARESATGPWKLADQKPDENFDVAKVSAITNAFASLIFADVLAPDAAVAETGLDQPSIARVETFDGFAYEFKIGKVMGDNYPVLVAVRAELPNERTALPDEKPEDKTRLDQEFQTRKKQLADKLEKEQKLTGRPYLIAKSTMEQVLKDRSTFMTDKASPSPSPTAPGAPSAAPPTSPAAKATKPSGPPAPTPSSSPTKRPK